MTVRADADEVRAEVADDGPLPDGPVGQGSGVQAAPAAGPVVGPVPQPSGGAGLGLAGMQERVAVHGGQFEAGPRPEGWFAVIVRDDPCAQDSGIPCVSGASGRALVSAAATTADPIDLEALT